MGGCCHGARQSCRQGPRLRPAGPLLSQGPTPPSAWHAWTWARKPLQGSFANGLESRDELAKTGSKLVGKAGGGHFCLAVEPGREQGESGCPGKPSAALPCLEARGQDWHWRQLTLNNLLMIL